MTSERDRDPRIGLGFDAHRFESGRPLVLGGVTIPESPGLAGHSDADVLSHAIADAILGAAAMGDLGEMFPADERWRNAPSLSILGEVAGVLAGDGWSIVNVDATIIAETPRVAGHRNAMVANVATSLGLPSNSVSIKATTTDGLGFTGRGEGIAALAIARVRRSGDNRG
jgi:2-C-methyl-D-erythritol 2,4-cyclodiphosphate synthase